MVKQIAPVRVCCVCLVVACGAVCQSGRAGGRTPQVVQVHRPGGPQQPVPVMVKAKELPDAPSTQVSKPGNMLETAADELRRSSMADAVAKNVTVPVIVATPRNALAFYGNGTGLYETAPSPKAASDFLSKYFYPSPTLLTRYRVSDSNSWMGRAADAASRILVTRDESGRRTLNTCYLLRVATSVAAHSASRPYWLRSGTEPISDFGSTVGNDAGMNLLHEFGPTVRHMVRGHLPEFVSRIEQGISRGAGRR